MTEQRYYDFFVNGKLWCTIEVAKEDILKGHKVLMIPQKHGHSLVSESDSWNLTAKLMAKTVRFQLADVCEYYPDNLPIPDEVGDYLKYRNYAAMWYTGFWVCDDTLYFEDNRLYWNGE